MEHRKYEVFNGKIEIPSSGIKWYSHRLNHTGKSNHIIHGSFSVSQGGENVESKIQFRIFSEEQWTNWFFHSLGNTGYIFLDQPKNFVHAIDASQNNFNFPVKRDATVYFALENRYLLTIKKQVLLNIIEEWDEESIDTDVFSTIPPQDESLKTSIMKMISDSKESLKIISPYIDMSLISNLIEKRNQGITVQIILKDEKEVKGLSKDGLNQIRKNFSQSHKLHPDVHSRVIIKDDKEVLISSADLTQKSLQAQMNIGIRTSDRDIVSKTNEFFRKVWQESK